MEYSFHINTKLNIAMRSYLMHGYSYLQDQYRPSCIPGRIRVARKGVNRRRCFLKTVVNTGGYVPERIYLSGKHCGTHTN